MKKKPRTIADLKFNWTFDFKWKNIREIKDKFEKLNPNLLKYRLKPGDYKFQIDNSELWFFATEKDPVQYLIDQLDVELSDQVEFKGKSPLRLVKFELIGENTFKIHTEEIKE